MSTDENPTTPTLKAEDLFFPGTIAEQVEMLMGVLTQGIVDCMIFATGAYPNLTEGPPDEPNAFAKPKAKAISTWQAARSAELGDAARLTEAGARLLTGFAKLRGQFSQDFTIRHNEKRKATKNRLRNTTITHSFSVPGSEAVSVMSIDPKTTTGLTRNLAKVADNLAEGRAKTRAAEEKKKGEAALDELYRQFGDSRDEDDADDAPPSGNPPPPPPGT